MAEDVSKTKPRAGEGKPPYPDPGGSPVAEKSSQRRWVITKAGSGKGGWSIQEKVPESFPMSPSRSLSFAVDPGPLRKKRLFSSGEEAPPVLTFDAPLMTLQQYEIAISMREEAFPILTFDAPLAFEPSQIFDDGTLESIRVWLNATLEVAEQAREQFSELRCQVAKVNDRLDSFLAGTADTESQ